MRPASTELSAPQNNPACQGLQPGDGQKRKAGE